MIRERLKAAARTAALKLFKMEKQMEPHLEPNQKLDRPPEAIDMSVIPRIVDGSGDTPGPNHKEDVGRTMLSAAIISSAGPVLIDQRPPAECAGGMLPGAICVPGAGLKGRPDLLPADKAMRVVVYDQLGSDESAALAQWVRDQGYVNGRRLRGGYAEWIEHDEPVVQPKPAAGGRFGVGDPVEHKDGKRYWVQEVLPGLTSRVWSPESGSVGPLDEADLK
ncbi:MAG: rhodanese-like domain-containing protein [Myxococcales bacterium]|nr:rhodanese-like domain-containing protein [Myxococcales bacterium]